MHDFISSCSYGHSDCAEHGYHLKKEGYPLESSFYPSHFEFYPPVWTFYSLRAILSCKKESYPPVYVPNPPKERKINPALKR